MGLALVVLAKGGLVRVHPFLVVPALVVVAGAMAMGVPLVAGDRMVLETATIPPCSPPTTGRCVR